MDIHSPCEIKSKILVRSIIQRDKRPIPGTIVNYENLSNTAGFIGFHLARRLLQRGDTVVGIDNVNDYSMPNVSEKVVRIILGYTDYIKRTVWNEE